MQQQVEKAGGNIHKTVTSRTNIVVTGENAGNSKLVRIKLLNKKGAKIEIIKEQEWLKIIQDI
jgi:BRCT domain type II-containing protein